MTRILVVYYSQTGQLTRAARAFLEPLNGQRDVVVDWHEVRPAAPYPFPWPFLTFFDAFPESVYLQPPPLAATPLNVNTPYDLVILAYQVWFLSPSLPITAFLKSSHAQVLNGRRVITLITCRNMWTTAHLTMQGLLRAAGAQLVDNVVLTDRGPLWSTFITTPWWLLTGQQGPWFGVLPRAGFSAADIAGTARFGRALVDALPAIERGERGPFLCGLQAVQVNRLTMLAERIGHRSFLIWGRLIRAAGAPGSLRRKPILLLYVAFLVAIILTVLPISMTIAAILARVSSRVAQQAAQLEAPSGSAGERLVRFKQ